MAFRRYDYKPLDETNREIRLLEFSPSEQHSSQIRCSIFTTALDDTSEYTALSYCWGDLSNPCTITLNDASLSTTSNLFSALQRLQNSSLRRFWVDAICINQNDLSERNHQVTLMREIYSQAEGTIIYLGEAADDSGLAIGLIKAWANAKNDFEEFIQQYPFAFEQKSWTAVEILAKRTWWTRVWVYQEFVVSKQVVFICGPDSMTNQTYRAARLSWKAFLLSKAATKVSKDQVLTLHSTGLGSIDELDWQRVIYELRRKRIRDNQPYDDLPCLDLLSLISFTSSMKATDPKDKLYALLGVDDVRDITIIPNYHHSVSKIYTDFAIKCIETRLSLQILGEAGIGFVEQASRLLPSWVPDLQQLGIKGQNLTYKFNCASGTKGFVCDAITDYCPPEIPWSQQMEKWAELALNAPRAHPTGISKVQAFFRTTTADQSGYGFGKPQFKDEVERNKFFDLARAFMYVSGKISLKHYRQNPLLFEKVQRWQHKIDGNRPYAAFLQLFLKLIPDEPVTKTDDEFLEPFLSSTSKYGELKWPHDLEIRTEEDEEKLAFNYVDYSSQATKRKSFFITKEGYMGLGPAVIQKGDKVCILFGCAHPLLLRKVEDAYLLVGEIYVYGMMRGEMIEELEAGKFAEKEFIIK